ncbi:MAG TPA: DUF6145 family protein [Lachnospiraceae bacterium]|jgi:hypothetical protein|nr:DUF6145 family protein [Lachnospiraceae bacterium]
MAEERTVLCGANAYEHKYYFNEQFNGLPDSIKEEIHMICVLFTEEVGGIFTMVYDEDGELTFEVMADPGDLLYDEVGSALLVKEIQRKRQELLESLSLFYKVFILKESVDEFLEEE